MTATTTDTERDTAAIVRHAKRRAENAYVFAKRAADEALEEVNGNDFRVPVRPGEAALTLTLEVCRELKKLRRLLARLGE